MNLEDERAKWPRKMQKAVFDYVEEWCTHISVDPEWALWELLEEAYRAGWDDADAELKEF